MYMICQCFSVNFKPTEISKVLFGSPCFTVGWSCIGGFGIVFLNVLWISYLLKFLGG